MKRRLLAAWALHSGAAMAAAIPFKQEGAGAEAAMPGGALGLLLVCALAIVVLLLLRKRLQLPGAPGAARLLKVLETRRLGARAQLAVIEFEGRRYLIAHSEQGVQCLVAPPAGQP